MKNKKHSRSISASRFRRFISAAAEKFFTNPIAFLNSSHYLCSAKQFITYHADEPRSEARNFIGHFLCPYIHSHTAVISISHLLFGGTVNCLATNGYDSRFSVYNAKQFTV